MIQTKNEENLFALVNKRLSEGMQFAHLDIPYNSIAADVDDALAAGLIPEEDREKGIIYMSFLLGIGFASKCREEVLPWDAESTR